jgi:hypothetical protein
MEENGCYTSQLNVTVDSSLDNKTVECIYNNGTTIVIGTSSIEIIKGENSSVHQLFLLLLAVYAYIIDPLPPPHNVIISDLAIMDEVSIRVTFEWVTNTLCPALFIS